jgi:phenylpyruvate tautomerase PptA (4-oxalocrotonate tautomerase family)
VLKLHRLGVPFPEVDVPTYVVETADNRLSAEEKHRIASGITQAHSGATGAQGFFAQVIFREIPQGNHFLGGAPRNSDQIFIHGHIRAGRTQDQKRRLLADIVQVVVSSTGTERRYVWVYVSELPPSQMVEYGRELPEPGTEAEWLDAMEESDRNYLLGIGR